jgi:hypothetical protein
VRQRLNKTVAANERRAAMDRLDAAEYGYGDDTFGFRAPTRLSQLMGWE